MKTVRTWIGILSIGLIALSSAQSLNEAWRKTGTPRTDVVTGAFAKNNRTVHLSPDYYSYQTQVICREANGDVAWTYTLPILCYPQAMLTTSDNLIYVSAVAKNYNEFPFVIALDQDGHYKWQFNYTQGNAHRQLREMRIFGDKLLVVGTGRTGIFGTDERLVLFSVNRFTGVLNFGREYLPGNSNMPENPKLRSGGGYAYIMGNKYDSNTGNGGTGVVKVDPATGDTVGYYAVSPFTAREFEVDSTGAIYLAGNSNYTVTGPDFRKINGTGSGMFPLMYRKPYGNDVFIISGGNIYVNEYSYDGVTSIMGMRKMRASDGQPLWFRPYSNEDGMWVFRADASGRLFGMRRLVDAVGVRWGMQQVNTTTGADLGPYFPVASSGVNELNTIPRSMAFNSFGEIFVTGTQDVPDSNRFWLVSRLFQTMEPVADAYTVVQGDLFATAGNGLLPNDKYTNPVLTTTALVGQTGPAKGTLNLGSNGEFTYLAKDGSAPLPVGVQSFRYRSMRGSAAVEAQVTLNIVRGVSTLALSRYTVAGSSTVGATVTISSAGAATTVALADSSPNVSVPASITIPSGKTTGTFIVTAAAVSSSEVAQITASFGGTFKTVNLNLQPLQVSSFVISPTITSGGLDFGVTIRLNGRAGPGGFHLNLSDDSPYVTTPGDIVVSAGETSLFLNLPTTDPPTDTAVRVTLTGSGSPIVKTVYVY